ncbi:MAG TPA: 50S ribosomal protein L4 [Clostridiales bacterium]|jgi:large subunit ribosomal protein L4|nr:50S ribosomal protein L4 [Clostridiales bacterium]
MPKINVYNQSGEKVGSMTLSDKVFGQEINKPLIHQVVVAQLANRRQGTKSALTRAEVRGGGRKPWRQKKTGRARHGSIRAPQWYHGGVVFAPKPRDFSQKVNKKAKTLALLSALSAKVSNDQIMVLDDLKLISAKTKEVADILSNLKLDKSVLLVLPEVNEEIFRASRNIPRLSAICSDFINVYDVVRHNKVVMLKSAVKKIEEAYGNE